MSDYSFNPIRPDLRRTSLELNPRPHEDTMTICIAGVFRGGTTMTAAVVHGLGIDLGPHDELNRGNSFEDISMKGTKTQQKLDYIERRNAEKPIWGWKNPSALWSFKKVHHSLRNPRYIIVNRDTLAVMQGHERVNQTLRDRPDSLSPEEREQSEMTVFDIITSVRGQEKRIWDFVQSTSEGGPWKPCPTLLVSYERALLNPEMFVDELIDFLGVNPPEEQREDAISRVNASGGYLHPGQKSPFDRQEL